MRLIQPLPGGTVEGARTHLVAAQAAAADYLNAPATTPRSVLLDGVTAAKRAASELFLAPPRSEFQDLVAARQQVIFGQQNLERAYSQLGTPDASSHLADVHRYVKSAFDDFEAAFEIIDND